MIDLCVVQFVVIPCPVRLFFDEVCIEKDLEMVGQFGLCHIHDLGQITYANLPALRQFVHDL